MYAVGQILAGKYRVDYMLGEGGMGVVLAATHMHLGTQVALKILRPEMAQGAVVERFIREARASAQLRSEYVCRVSDVGVLENGIPFIVMEMLVGHDLQSMLRQTGPMPIAVASEYILQASIGIAEAHAAKIVHRDLKPGNLMWTQRPDGTTLVKVLDFGVAKAPEGLNFSLTQTSNIIGSPGYMSPEQLKSSKDVDVRSDIWSLGIMIYELVSGRPPWNGDSITELALKVAMDPMPPLVGMGPFEAVIQTCLEKEPARRYQNVGELAAALAPFAGPVGADLAGAVARVLRGSQVAIPQPPGTKVMSTPTTLRGASGVIGNRTHQGAQRSWKLPAAIGLGVAGGIIAVVLATSGGKVDDGSHAPPASESAKPALGGGLVDTAKTAIPAGAESAPQPPPTDPKLDTAKPDTAKTDTTKIDTKPDPAKPDTKFDAAKTDTKSDTTKSNASKSNPSKSNTTKTDAAKSDETKKTDAAKAHKKTDTPKSTTKKTNPTPKPPEDVGDSRT